MIKKLTVRNLAIVERVEVEFVPGLNVITGETGAGKSVLMGALELVLGGRAESSVVRDGAKEAEVEVDFGDHVVRRTVTAEGRSRAWIDDESVSVAELREFGRTRVDIHGPRANQLLLEERFQRETLDLFGGVDLSGYARAYAALASLRAAREALLAGGGEDEADLLRYQVDELEAAALSEADDTLAERHAAAAHAEEIVANANAVTEGLGGDGGAAAALAALRPGLAALVRHYPPASDWQAKVEELTVEVQELSRSVADAVSRLDVGEEDLAELDARLTLLSRLRRKYLTKAGEGGVGSRLLEVLAEKRRRLDELANRESRLASLARELASAEAEVLARGAEVTAARRRAAERLAKAITRELHDLGFLRADFAVAVEATAEPTAHGLDRVCCLFAPNPGEPARPLAAIASSGEIARVMLAVKVVVSVGAATLVFDEIDANIGGEVGRVVGEKLRAVAARHQVLAITHLPQSAVYGARHFVVSKSVSGGRTRAGLEVVSGERRVREIARMLGGEKLTSVVKRHAEELLQLPG